MEVTFKLRAGRALHRRQHARAACAQGVLRLRQALAAGLLRRQGRAALDARGDRGGRAAGGRRMSSRALDRDNDRPVPRRHFRAARRGGISRRAGDHGRAHAAGRMARRAGGRAATSWSPRRCCTTSATSPASSAPIRPTTSRTSTTTRPAPRCLAPFFPPVVTECVRLHVAAKRYLCATDPTYFGKALAGLGPYAVAAGRADERRARSRRSARIPFHDEAVRVRLWDEGGKVAGHEDARLPRLRAAAAARRRRPRREPHLTAGGEGTAHVFLLRRRRRGGCLPATGLRATRPSRAHLLRRRSVIQRRVQPACRCPFVQAGRPGAQFAILPLHPFRCIDRAQSAAPLSSCRTRTNHAFSRRRR